jgi:hypothetical protein
MFYKLGTIAALLAALAAPSSAAAQRARTEHEARGQAFCPQALVFLPGRKYATCGGRFWVRDPETGKVQAIPFGRLQHLQDSSGDRP